MLRNLAPILLMFMIIIGVFAYMGCSRQAKQLSEISFLKSADRGDRSIVASITIPDPSLNLVVPGPRDCTFSEEV